MFKELAILVVASIFLGVLAVSLGNQEIQAKYKIPEDDTILLGVFVKNHGDYDEFRWTSYEILENPRRKVKFSGVHKLDAVTAEKYRFLPKS